VFDGVTAVTVRRTDFWILRPFGLERARRFGKTYRLYQQGEKYKPSEKPAKIGGKMEAIFSTETSGFLLTIRRYIPKARTLNVTISNRCPNR
jgi:hypothetical protein